MSKSTKIDNEILSILEDYHLFLDCDKSIEMPYKVDGVAPNHKSSLRGSAPLLAKAPIGNTSLDCEMRNRSEFDYSLNILSDAIKNRVLFRMDEGDGTHRNRHLPIPVDQQQVTTPHFHKVGDDGIMLAYRTDNLESLGKPLNIQVGFKAFCEECHINQENSQITIHEKGTLPFENTPEIDPLIDIQFP